MMRGGVVQKGSRGGLGSAAGPPNVSRGGSAAMVQRQTAVPTAPPGTACLPTAVAGGPMDRQTSVSSTAGSSEKGTSGGGVNVKVIVRCRPIMAHEEMSSVHTPVECKPNLKEIVVHQPTAGRKADVYNKTYTFDGVCAPEANQTAIFNDYVVPIVDEVLQGFNCTIFAYGQTGTGKTYTMEGDWGAFLNNDSTTPLTVSSSPTGLLVDGSLPRAELPASAGIIPRSVALIFQRLQEQCMEYSVKVSYLEIYNEELNDLLQDGEKVPLRIFESSTSGVTGTTVSNGPATKGLAVDKLEEVVVKSWTEVYQILVTAVKKRRTAETLLNRQSSRSHSIFTLTIHTKETSLEGEDVIKIGKLNLVDLAGSENIQRSGASTAKDRTKEAGMINQSLLTLGRVINSLVEHSSYIPYRDSKLTRLLQDSLGGRTKTCIVATVTPSTGCLEETMSTLDYAHRAKNIKNRPEVNQRTTQRVVLKEMTLEIERLRQELMWAREKSGDVYLSTERFAAIQTQTETQTNLIGALQETLRETRAVGDEYKQRSEALGSEKKQLTDVNEMLSESLQVAEKQLVKRFAWMNRLTKELRTKILVEGILSDDVKSLDVRLSRVSERVRALILTCKFLTDAGLEVVGAIKRGQVRTKAVVSESTALPKIGELSQERQALIERGLIKCRLFLEKVDELDDGLDNEFKRVLKTELVDETREKICSSLTNPLSLVLDELASATSSYSSCTDEVVSLFGNEVIKPCVEEGIIEVASDARSGWSAYEAKLHEGCEGVNQRHSQLREAISGTMTRVADETGKLVEAMGRSQEIEAVVIQECKSRINQFMADQDRIMRSEQETMLAIVQKFVAEQSEAHQAAAESLQNDIAKKLDDLWTCQNAGLQDVMESTVYCVRTSRHSVDECLTNNVKETKAWLFGLQTSARDTGQHFQALLGTGLSKLTDVVSSRYRKIKTDVSSATEKFEKTNKSILERTRVVVEKASKDIETVSARCVDKLHAILNSEGDKRRNCCVDVTRVLRTEVFDPCKEKERELERLLHGFSGDLTEIVRSTSECVEAGQKLLEVVDAHDCKVQHAEECVQYGDGYSDKPVVEVDVLKSTMHSLVEWLTEGTGENLEEELRSHLSDVLSKATPTELKKKSEEFEARIAYMMELSGKSSQVEGSTPRNNDDGGSAVGNRVRLGRMLDSSFDLLFSVVPESVPVDVVGPWKCQLDPLVVEPVGVPEEVRHMQQSLALASAVSERSRRQDDVSSCSKGGVSRSRAATPISRLRTLKDMSPCNPRFGGQRQQEGRTPKLAKPTSCEFAFAASEPPRNSPAKDPNNVENSKPENSSANRSCDAKVEVQGFSSSRKARVSSQQRSEILSMPSTEGLIKGSTLAVTSTASLSSESPSTDGRNKRKAEVPTDAIDRSVNRSSENATGQSRRKSRYSERI